MAERKSGPVKPPVIDLTAKPATRSRSAAGTPAATPDPVTAGEAVVIAESAPEAVPAEAIAVPAAEAASEQVSEAVAPPVVEEAKAEVEEAPAVASDPTAESVGEAPRPPPPPRPQARLAMPWSAISIAAIAGAVLGTVLTYILVNFLALPDSRPSIADPGPQLAAQDKAIADLTARLAAAEDAAKATLASAERATAGVSADLDTLRQQVAALPAPAAVDLAPLQQQVASLEDRVAAISAGASGADATALAQTISGLEASLGEVRSALDALSRRTATAEQSVTTLRGDVDATKSAVAAQVETNNNEIGPAVRLPLLVSGLESAFTTGRPYGAELNGLAALLPKLDVPDAVGAAASSGLPRPDAVAARFTEAVPAILAARTVESSGDLGQDALEWAKGLLALRPVDETEGATPEAVVSRLEAAIGRRDFAGAAALLDQLPAAMQAEAGTVAADIRTLAAADGFIATLRAQVLDTEPAEATP